MQSGVFHPGFEFKQQSNEYINVVHILAIHGWSVMDSTALEVSTQFADFASQTVRDLLSEKNWNGTVLKVTPLSGCKIFQGELENKQTIGDRILGCIEELKEGATMQELKKADYVYVVAHSQGAVIATILTEMLIEGGILTPHIQGVQKVCLLTMAGVHHGTHEEIRLARFWRESSTELKLLQDPSYELFAHQYLPAVFNILKKGVIIVPVCAYNDRVVNLCSATMDGIDHPNIIRACYIHSRYLDPTLINPGNLNTNYIFEHDILLSLWLIVIQARNERIFVDAARFLTNVFVGTQAVSALGEVGKIAWSSVQEMPPLAASTSSFLGKTVASAVSFGFTFGKKVIQNQQQLEHTNKLTRDSDAHSVIHQDKTVYRFGFSILLSIRDVCPNNAGEYETPTIRPSFNRNPTKEEWIVFEKSLIEIARRGSPALKNNLQKVYATFLKNPKSLHESAYATEIEGVLTRLAKPLPIEAPPPVLQITNVHNFDLD